MDKAPWIEKYRPTQLADIVLEPYNRQLFENIIQQKTPYFPNLLLYGPPGTGKTSSIINLIGEYQKRNNPLSNNCNVIHLNASDERGIDIIRNQIKQFIRSANLFEAGMKFVIMDEVDYMTKSAQLALKFILQTFGHESVRFFLICNYISKIDDSLQKEFVCIQFNRLPQEEIVRFLMNIVQKEGLSEWSEKKVAMLVHLFNYDIRSMINFLQLNQDNIMEEEILLGIQTRLSSATPADTAAYIRALSSRYGINEKEIIHSYFDYLLRDGAAEITPEFGDLVEIIVHNSDNPVVVDFFAFHMSAGAGGRVQLKTTQ